MRIGLTYDLRPDYLAAGYTEEETAEFDSPITVDALESAVRTLGHEPDRIGSVRSLVEKLAAGERWDLVFNICEGMHGRAREAQVPALLDAYEIPHTFSDPLIMALSLDKGLTKTVVRAAGVPTPEEFVVRQLDDLDRMPLPFPLFAKPIAEGTGKGITGKSKITSRAQLAEVCAHLLDRFRQPVLVERFLPGREFTVAIWGTGEDASVIGTMEILLLDTAEPEVYSYVNKERCEEFVRYRLGDPERDEQVRESERISLLAWRALGCRDAGRIDVRCDEHGQACFIEVNPLAGLHPDHSDLPIICGLKEIPYLQLIERIVESAAQRIPNSARVRVS